MPFGRNRPSPVIMKLRASLLSDHLILSVLAVVIGVVVGGCAVAFLGVIDWVQVLGYGVSGDYIVASLRQLSWPYRLGVPTIGGLLVGLLLYFGMRNGKPKGPADVIAAAEGHGAGVSLRDGTVNFFASALSIGVGASVGREGPAVHMGAVLATVWGRLLGASHNSSRIFMACGVAAAVSASFNAPIAGALFAQEVILSHYALKAFAPVVVASVSATLMMRYFMGNVTAFGLGDFALNHYGEMPFFAVLGIVCGIGAVVFVSSTVWLQKQGHHRLLPPWLRPALAGAVVGAIGLLYPEVIGLGYEATDNALQGRYEVSLLIGLLCFKALATVVSLGGGFAGGVFSPSLVLGALIGGVFGFGVMALVPLWATATGAYALVGMAAFAAAVLGAPISTSLIIFELTGDYGISIAVMVACVLSSATMARLGGRSFFLAQLKTRGLDVEKDYDRLVLKRLTVAQVPYDSGAYVPVDAPYAEVIARLNRAPSGVVFVITHDRRLYGTVRWEDLPDDETLGEITDIVIAADLATPYPPTVIYGDTLEVVQAVFETSGWRQVAVVSDKEEQAYLGAMDERDMMALYAKALVQQRRAEQGQNEALK